MAFEVPIAEDFKPESFERIPNGRYHGVLHSVEEDGGDKGEMLCDFEAVAGTVPNQEGKYIKDSFLKQMNMMWKFHRLALALKMISPEEMKKLKAEGRSPSYDFPASLGRQVHIEISDSKKDAKYQEKTYYKIDDPYCAAWPKNAGLLKSAGITVPTAPPAGTNGTGNGSSQSPSSVPEVNLSGVV